jgi:hypothetical protein
MERRRDQEVVKVRRRKKRLGQCEKEWQAMSLRARYLSRTGETHRTVSDSNIRDTFRVDT